MDNKKPSIIGNLESSRKNESNIFKGSRFKPENMSTRKVFITQKAKEQMPIGGKSEISKREIYRNLLKDSAFCEQATKEGKTPWEFAKELIENLPADFNPLMNKDEMKAGVSYYQYYKSIRKNPHL